MSKRVFKFRVDANISSIPIQLPVGSKVIHFAWQAGTAAFHIWVELNTENTNTEPRVFRVYPTGIKIPDTSVHIGSFLMSDQFHIFHCYELK